MSLQSDSPLFTQTVALPIFPTFIWLHQLAPDRVAALNQQMMAALEELMGPLPELQPGETWQSDQTLHRYPEFAPLVELIRTASTGVLDALEVVYDDFSITGCWVNMNPPGSPHPTHTHPNNLLSGVYYVQVPEKVDMISFQDPRAQRYIIDPAVRSQNQFNQLIHNVKVETGTLAMFPACLPHSVIPNESQEVRISIAFNIMLSDFAETVAQAKWPGIKLRRPPPEA